MLLSDLISNPAFARALVIGLFGAAGLALTTFYSRRGPMIFPVYAAILAALTVLLARHGPLTFAQRYSAAIAGYLVASLGWYVANVIKAGQARSLMIADGRLPQSARSGVSLGGHAWRLGLLIALGAIVSVGVAFVGF